LEIAIVIDNTRIPRQLNKKTDKITFSPDNSWGLSNLGFTQGLKRCCERWHVKILQHRNGTPKAMDMINKIQIKPGTLPEASAKGCFDQRV
jgi:hypothetical protein